MPSIKKDKEIEQVQKELSNLQGNDHNTYFMLGRIDGKLDAALSKLEHNDKILDEHECRITGLEKWKSWAIGIVLGLSAAAGVAGDKITDAFSKFWPLN